MPKLIIGNKASNAVVTLNNDEDADHILKLENVVISLPNIPATKINGVTEIEVNDNCNLTVPSSELPLNIINIIHGTINLSNDYEGVKPVAILIGANSKYTQTGKDLPMNIVTIGAQSDFNFINQGASYNIHNPAPSFMNMHLAYMPHIILPANFETRIITIKDPHKELNLIRKIATNPKSAKLNDFKQCKKFINLLSKENNLSKEAEQIESYIIKHYFELTGVVKQHYTIHSTVQNDALGILPDNILVHICYFLDLTDVIQPRLIGESS